MADPEPDTATDRAGPSNETGLSNETGPSDRTGQFVQLLTTHQPQIYAYIASALFGDSAASDVLQDTNLSLWAQMDRYDFSRPFLPWAFGFARQQVMAYRKKCSRSRLLFCDESINLLTDHFLESSAHSDTRLAALEKCLKRLSPPQAELIHDRYSAKTPVQLIARRLEVPAHSVSSRLHRLRKILVTCVQQTIASEAH